MRVMVNGRLTDQEIEQALSLMKASEADKDALRRQALAGNPGARFVLYAKLRKAGVI